MPSVSTNQHSVIYVCYVCYKHSNFCNSRNIESSRSTSLEFAAFGNGSDIKHGRASAFRYFLSTTMVFAADQTHLPKKNTRVYVNSAVINKQLFNYYDYSSFDNLAQVV